MERDMMEIIYLSSYKLRYYWSHFNETGIFSYIFQKYYKNQNPYTGTRKVPCEQTDR